MTTICCVLYCNTTPSICIHVIYIMHYLMRIHFSTFDAICMSTNSQMRYSGYGTQLRSIAHETPHESVGFKVELSRSSYFSCCLFP